MVAKPVFLLFSFLFLLITGAHSAMFRFVNNCPFTVRPETHAGLRKPRVSLSNVNLGSGVSIAIDMGPAWSESCETEDSALGQVAENASIFNYHLTLIDGFNLPISLHPVGRSGSCDFESSPADVNAVCPPSPPLEDVNGSSDGGVIPSKSACLAFNQPQHCSSTGQFGSAMTCPQTEYWMSFETQFSKKKKKKKTASTYHDIDVKPRSIKCSGATSYVVTFCPYEEINEEL